VADFSNAAGDAPRTSSIGSDGPHSLRRVAAVIDNGVVGAVAPCLRISTGVFGSLAIAGDKSKIL
jgi:hypothetical protein